MRQSRWTILGSCEAKGGCINRCNRAVEGICSLEFAHPCPDARRHAVLSHEISGE
jgi:hypothetical protein